MRIIHKLLYVVIALGVFYAGACVYQNFIAGDGTVKMPGPDRAQYTVLIENTGGVLLTDRYSINGTAVTLYGFWEKYNNKFVYRDYHTTIDTRVFGPWEILNR